VIFDCDGVLVDSERIGVRIDVVVLARIGWVMTEADVIERFMGRTDEYMASQIEAHLGRPLPADWDAPFQHLYRDAFEAELTPVGGDSRGARSHRPRDLRGVERHPRTDPVHAGAHRTVQPVRRPNLQRD